MAAGNCCDIAGDEGGSLWICHICDATGRGESRACAVCYKTTCALHLQTRSFYNEQSGLYELQPVCLWCATTGAG